MTSERGLPNFQMILDAVPTPCALLNRETVIVAANETYLSVCGRQRADLIGKKLFEAFPANPDDTTAEGQLAAHASIDRVLATGQADTMDEIQYDIARCGAFEERHWRVVNNPIPGPDGKVAWILHQVEDVSERTQAQLGRRKAEEALSLASAARLSVLNSVEEGFIVLDRDFNVLEINREGLRQDGRGADAILGRSHWDVWPGSAGTAIEAGYRRALAQQVPVSLEHHYVGEGHDRWLDVRIYPTAEGLAVLFRDITERKQAQQAGEAARDEAEQANASKSRFLAAASHDLRQPIQSLFLFTDMLAAQIGDSAHENTVAMVRKSLETLKGLLDSLFDVSRLDTGNITPDLRPVSLNKIVAEVVAPYAMVVREKGLSLSWQSDPSADGAQVLTDPTLLGRMLSNLLENAIRYTTHGDITVSCHVDGGYGRVVVKDTGIGIPGDQLSKIFDEFHQVGNTERDRDKGLGLGLSIVKRLSLLLHHPVEVRSRLGEGSVFTIALPLADDQG